MLLILIATLAACAGTRTQSTAGEYVDDSVITTKVKSLLAEDDFLKSFQISVESFKGTVQLSGFVNSQKAVDKAGEIARSVKGVTSENFSQTLTEDTSRFAAGASLGSNALKATI